jgi:Pro-kumamolisin, activation domain
MISAARACFVCLVFLTFPGGSFAVAQEGNHTQNSPTQIGQCADDDHRGDMGMGQQVCDERNPKCGPDLRCPITHHEECAQYREGCAADREEYCQMRKPLEERRCDGRVGEFGGGQGCDAVRIDDEKSLASGITNNPDLKIGQFVLYAERSLSLGACDAVRHGDLGVRSLTEASHGSQLKIGRDSFVQPSHIVLSPSVLVGENVTLGAVGADQFRDNGLPLGPAAPFPAAAMPPLPLAQGGGSKGSDVSVARGQALALPPGHFGILKVDGVLLLNPGVYVAKEVLIGDFGRIVAITGDVQMSIVGTFTAGRHTAIYPDFGLSAKQFTIAVGGYDDAKRPAASIGEHSFIRALLAAPHGTLSLADHVRATGAFAAFDIAVGEHAQIEFQDGFPADPTGGHGSQQLSGYFTPSIFNAAIVGPVAASTVVSLAIGLPVQNSDALKQAVQQTSDPANPSYRKYLSPNQFAATFSPTPPNYQSLIEWAQANGLSVVKTYSNRLLLDVSGTAAQVEQALFISLNLRLRPDGSQFYALDRDPSIDLAVPVLWISGLDNRVVAVPGGGLGPTTSGAGSGPNGTYNSSDIRAAYASCVPSLTGGGQAVGLFELDGFTANDVSTYECVSGGATCTASGAVTSSVPTVNTVLLDGATGAPASVATGGFEAALDIEMAIAMAPGLGQIDVFEAPNTGNAAFHNDILNNMATTQPLINELSSSWFFSTDANTQPILYALALQGQTFFQAAGDQGSSSWGTDPGDIRDEDAVTVVGGTNLTMTGTPPAYSSETPWNIAGQGAGGGGIAANVTIPIYQTGVNMTSNAGSTTKRDLPDVAAVATNLSVVATNPVTGMQSTKNQAFGTSAAAPLWAGFVALANQQVQTSVNGFGTVGSVNPLLYAIGENAAAYGLSFNDLGAVSTTTGNNNGTCTGQSGTSSAVCAVITPPSTAPKNNWTPGTGSFSSVTGYDLATGWGTPQCALMNEMTFGFTNVVSLKVTIRTGNDNARPDSEIQGTLNGEPAFCLKPSNNANSDAVCPNGGSATDQNGNQEWKNFTNSAQIFTLATPQPATSLNALTIQLISHNHGFETDDNWDIQGITVATTGTNPKTLLNVSNPDNGDNCIVRLTGKIGSHTFILNLGNPTGSNPGIPPGSCPQSQ